MLKHLLLFSLINLTIIVPTMAADHLNFVFYTEDYPPFSYLQEGEVTGLNTDLLRAAAEEANINVRFRVVPWARAQAWTQSQSDACFFSAVRSTVREPIYQWVGPLSMEYITLFSADGNFTPLATVKDAAKYTIGGRISDAYTDWVEQQGLIVERNATTTNISKLVGGRVDLWIAGSIGGPYSGLVEGVTLYPIAQSEESFSLWLACNAHIDPTVITSLNLIIERYRNSGVIETLLQKYR